MNFVEEQVSTFFFCSLTYLNDKEAEEDDMKKEKGSVEKLIVVTVVVKSRYGCVTGVFASCLRVACKWPAVC